MDPVDFPLTARSPAWGWRHGLLAAVVLVCGFALYTRHNDFPAHYHPDEPGKVRQIREQTFNFNHPLLLLQTARALGARPGDPQPAIVQAGRTSSALFCAAAAASIALLAASLAGLPTGILAGAFVLSNRQFYELAHYMKEDPGLAFGVALSALLFVRAWDRPSAVAFLALGAACGIAISAKYIGALTLALPLACAARHPRRGVHAAICLAGVVAVIVLLNWPAIVEAPAFLSGLGREMDFAVRGHKGLTRSVPHGVYGAVFREATNPAIWILLALCGWRLLGSFRSGMWRRCLPDLCVVAFVLLYVVILSFSPKTHHRYFLPLTGLLLALAATEAGRLLAAGGLQRALGATLALAALIFGCLATLHMDRAFANDARAQLVAFVLATLPQDASIAQDKRVGLPIEGDPRFEGAGSPLPQTILGKLFAADVGSIEDLRSRGIHYVAVSEGDYGRFFLNTHSPREEDAWEYERRKAFYSTLFEQGRLLWECPAGPLPYLQPSIQLYSIAPP
jgi:hypothetical protein